jgi:aminoacrylate hydrolase
MPTVTVDEGEIYYETHGNGPPVLLVPGLGGLGSYWGPNIPAFSASHKVIIHDHRGLGRSSRSLIRYSVDQMTRDLVAVMDHLGIDKAHLVGHSTGGAIGQTLAITRPERLLSLTIYASWTKSDSFFRRVFETRRTLLMQGGTPAYVRSTPVFLYPDWWINDNIDLIESREKTAIPAFPPAEIAASRIDAIVAFDRTAGLGSITAPTLVICAKDDILTPPYFSRALASAIPGAQFIELDRGGHCASETNTAAFNAAVLGFIRTHS